MSRQTDKVHYLPSFLMLLSSLVKSYQVLSGVCPTTAAAAASAGRRRRRPGSLLRTRPSSECCHVMSPRAGRVPNRHLSMSRLHYTLVIGHSLHYSGGWHRYLKNHTEYIESCPIIISAELARAQRYSGIPTSHRTQYGERKLTWIWFTFAMLDFPTRQGEV